MSSGYEAFKTRNRLVEELIGSKTGCVAKWYQTTLHLQNGLTQSCYNNPQHPIDLNLIKSSPMALHNTTEKALQRTEMKNGGRPTGCNYCWRIEDQGGDAASDRMRWNNYLGRHVDPQDIRRMPANHMFTPKVLEVSFSNLCNFMCGYCHPKNSSRYYSEIKIHGKYPDVSHDCDIHFLKIYDEDNNPYLDAFWEWWPELSKDLITIRLTGGEPLIQKSTVKLIDSLRADPRPNLDLSINTNLGLPHKMFIQRCELLRGLLDSGSINTLHLYTSIDTWGKQAEYIRHGLDLDTYIKNTNYFLTHFPNEELIYMVTFNIFSLPQFKGLLQFWLNLKKEYNTGDFNRIRSDLNLLTEPILYSYTILPPEIALPLFDEIEDFASSHYEAYNLRGFNDFVLNDIRKVKNDYLRNQITDPERLAAYRREFITYFQEHDRRRKTDLYSTFPEYRDFFDLCKNLKEQALSVPKEAAEKGDAIAASQEPSLA